MEVKMNLTEFNAQMHNFTKLFEPRVTKSLIQKIALDLWKEIISRTPVDTGRARANWQLDENYSATSTFKDFGKSSGTPKTGTPPPYGSGPHDPVIPDISPAHAYEIFNNLVYIERLEQGHSKQSAPNAMVAGSLQNLTRQLEARARELGYFK